LVLFIKGANASADFSSIDSSGCVTTTVHVEAGSEVIRDPNAVPPTLATVGAYLVITRVDSCLATTSVWQGFSDTVTYTYDRRLTQAHLTGTVVACDPDTGVSCLTLSVDLTWSGFGPAAIVRDKTRTISGEFLLITRLRAELRSAVVTGTVSDGTTNYTPAPSYAGYMAWATTREVTVHRRHVGDPEE